MEALIRPVRLLLGLSREVSALLGFKKVYAPALLAGALVSSLAAAQTGNFGGNAQHTGLYSGISAKTLNKVHTTITIDEANNGAFAHYGMPLIRNADEFYVPVKTAGNGFRVDGYRGGGLAFSLVSDYIMPPHNWIPVYQPAFGYDGNFRIFYPGAGGSLLKVNVDNQTSINNPNRRFFYTDPTTYQSNKAAYDSSVFINTPITVAPSGVIYFGFRIEAHSVSTNVSTGADDVTQAVNNSSGMSVGDVVHFYTANANRTIIAVPDSGHIVLNASVSTTSGESLKATTPPPAPFRLGRNQAGADPVGGYVRMDANNNATYVFTDDASTDDLMTRDCHNSAPALSNDGTTLYVVSKWDKDAYNGYLLALDATTLAPKFKASLLDPRNGNPAGILDDSTATPMVGPDGDVYIGTFANPYDGSRGFLQHFSDNLALKNVGAFGWDYTPAIVPANMVPSYHGSSSYLLFCKYNNYNLNDGNGINTVAILDPNSLQTDGHTGALGLPEMREVVKAIGPTPDSEYPGVPGAVREWCINAAAVNPDTNSIFFDSEDGHVYRWNTSTNCLSEALALTSGIGEPYVPTTIAPDGTVFSMNGGNLFLMGAADGGVSFTLASSSPDMRNNLSGDSITFTATVHSGVLGAPTGSFTFTDTTYDDLTPVTTTLASNVPVDSNGVASITTTALTAGGTFLGNHFITAAYSGDPAPGSVTMVQKVHAAAVTVQVTSSSPGAPSGSPVTFDVQLSSTGPIPTGYVTLSEGSKVLGQRPVDGGGLVHFGPFTNLSGGAHTITAYYNSDTYCAAASGTTTQTMETDTTTSLKSSLNPSTYGSSVTFTATVSPIAGASGTPSGTVTFSEGATVLGSSSTSGGVATLTTSALGGGVHTITATFTGDAGWHASSDNLSQKVSEGTSLAIGGTPNPSTAGQPITISVTVTPTTAGTGTPTGSVVFTIDGVSGSSMPLDGNGQAFTNATSLGAGNHTISAAFTGTGGWGNSSNSYTQVVNSATDTTAPSIPSGVSAVSGPGKNAVTISWTASTDPDDAVNHYEIWRSNKPAGGFTQVGSSTTTSYTDNAGKGQTRYYYVIAVDSHGNKSAKSVTITGKA